MDESRLDINACELDVRTEEKCCVESWLPLLTQCLA